MSLGYSAGKGTSLTAFILTVFSGTNWKKNCEQRMKPEGSHRPAPLPAVKIPGLYRRARARTLPPWSASVLSAAQHKPLINIFDNIVTGSAVLIAPRLMPMRLTITSLRFGTLSLEPVPWQMQMKKRASRNADRTGPEASTGQRAQLCNLICSTSHLQMMNENLK